MLIENMMYFALGLLVAGLIALVIMPAVWKRAVRLTKRRIEAATPITLSEFRADKDQLRAEFALTTRRLEMNIETLRKRLAEQLGDVNQKRTDLGALKFEREKNIEVVTELEVRQVELQARIAQLEKESTDLAQRLRMRERELETRQSEIESLRLNLQHATDQSNEADTDALVSAEARIASAESRLSALLAESTQAVAASNGRADQLLADKLNLDDEVERLRKKVANVESSIMADWESERLEEAHMREKLNDIAASVSRLVYAVDHDAPLNDDPEESLFDRVQRFADDGETFGTLTPPMPETAKRGSVSDRLSALREIQGR